MGDLQANITVNNEKPGYHSNATLAVWCDNIVMLYCIILLLPNDPVARVNNSGIIVWAQAAHHA